MTKEPKLFKSGKERFVTTHWSVIARAADQPASETAQAALSVLYCDYWPPVYGFIRQRGYGRAEAEDLTQEFFTYLLDKHAYAKADSLKGKFRSFLLGWLKNFLLAAQSREGRMKRGGEQSFVFLDTEIHALECLNAKELTANPPADEERLFESHWAILLIRRAMKALEAEYARGARAQIFAELKPFLQGGIGLPSHADLAERLGMPVETLRSHLSRLRASYRAILCQEVARTVPEESDIDEELRFLYRVLMAGSFEPPL